MIKNLETELKEILFSKNAHTYKLLPLFLFIPASNMDILRYFDIPLPNTLTLLVFRDI
jgi:hypothetical protein